MSNPTIDTDYSQLDGVMTDRPVRTPSAAHPITVEPTGRRVVVALGGDVLAETDRALTLREAGYPAVQYIPRADVLLTIALLAFVALGYLVFSRFVPLVPVWEILEGQILKGVQRIGRALLPSRSEPH